MNNYPASGRDTNEPSKSYNDDLQVQNTLQALFDNLPVCIYVVNPDYKLVAINKARLNQLKDIGTTLLNQPCYKALFHRDSPCPACLLTQTIGDGQSTKRYERRPSSRSGFSEWEISTYPIYSNSQLINQILVVEQDITEKRRLENILTQSEKLAIVGEMAASIAHELNNPLTAILANAQIIRRDLSPNSDMQESLELIIQASQRAALFVQDLLNYSRIEEFHLTETDIQINLQHSIELIQHELDRRKIILEFNSESDLPFILVSKDHLQSVWINLLMNAIDSMDKSPGQIGITTKLDHESVQIIISDNGTGIPPEKISRIFEPFYTTKPSGKGTGLGLSISQRIVKQHGGSIHATSQPGIGSQFTVTLPIISLGFIDE